MGSLRAHCPWCWDAEPCGCGKGGVANGPGAPVSDKDLPAGLFGPGASIGSGLNEPPARGRKPRPKPKPDADPAVAEFYRTFHDECVARHGFKPDPRQYGRCGRDVKQLVASAGVAEMQRLAHVFFTTTDPRVLRSDYDLKSFLLLFNHLRLLDRRVPDDRAAANLDAASRAVNGRRQR